MDAIDFFVEAAGSGVFPSLFADSGDSDSARLAFQGSAESSRDFRGFGEQQTWKGTCGTPGVFAFYSPMSLPPLYRATQSGLAASESAIGGLRFRCAPLLQ
jgi:hypothetical protein